MVLDYNIKSQRFSQDMGFKREGILCKRIFKNNGWHDEYIYGLLHENFISYNDGNTPWQVKVPNNRY